MRDEEGNGRVDFSSKGEYVLSEERDKSILECKEIEEYDDRVIAKLVLESMGRGESVIVFCMPRNSCITTCRMLTKAIRSLSRYVAVYLYASPFCQHLEPNSRDLVTWQTWFSDADRGVGDDLNGKMYAEEVHHQRSLVIGHLKMRARGPSTALCSRALPLVPPFIRLNLILLRGWP